MLRLRTIKDDHPEIPIRIDRMGIGRGMGQQDGLDAQTLESLVIMTDEIAAFERDALGLGPAAMPEPPRSMVPLAPAAEGGGWMNRYAARFAGLAASVMVGVALWQYAAPVTHRTPTSTAATNRAGGREGTSFVHSGNMLQADRDLAWVDDSPRMAYAGISPVSITPVNATLASEDRSLILAVFKDDDSPWCECVKVQAGSLCSGERVDQVSKDELVMAAMDSSCMYGADRVSVFAFTGPASKLPATREEAEALAIMLADLPNECLKSDPCVQHVASTCLPTGVSMVSQTLALNDVKAGW